MGDALETLRAMFAGMDDSVLTAALGQASAFITFVFFILFYFIYLFIYLFIFYFFFSHAFFINIYVAYFYP